MGCFLFHDPPTTKIYTLSLHDALPIYHHAHNRNVKFGAREVDCDNALDPDSAQSRSEEHTSELQSLRHLVCRLLLEKKNGRFRLEVDDELLQGVATSAIVDRQSNRVVR